MGSLSNWPLDGVLEDRIKRNLTLLWPFDAASKHVHPGMHANTPETHGDVASNYRENDPGFWRHGLYRLRTEGFRELKHYDGISPAWPISYDEMEPYCTKAEQMYHVPGLRV